MLSNTQHAALAAFEKVRAFTETGLSKAMRCEKAVARTIINQLESTGHIRKIGPYEWNISTTGQLYLRQHKTAPLPAPALPPVQKAQPPAPAPAPKPMPQPPAPVPPKPDDGMAALMDEPPVFVPTPPTPRAPTLPFDQLVRQGLQRLNDRLGYVPPAIENAALKVEALEQLANGTACISGELSTLVLSIADDIKKFSTAAKG